MIVLITGASAGFGEAMARKFVANGHRVIAAARRSERLVRLRDELGGMFVVSDATIKYLQPARLDDELIVTAVLQEAGHASMTIAQRALLKPKQPTDTPVLLCEGTIRIGWVEASTMRPARIPNFLTQVLS